MTIKEYLIANQQEQEDRPSGFITVLRLGQLKRDIERFGE